MQWYAQLQATKWYALKNTRYFLRISPSPLDLIYAIIWNFLLEQMPVFQLQIVAVKHSFCYRERERKKGIMACSISSVAVQAATMLQVHLMIVADLSFILLAAHRDLDELDWESDWFPSCTCFCEFNIGKDICQLVSSLLRLAIFWIIDFSFGHLFEKNNRILSK